MQLPTPDLREPIAAALLIGLLVGAQQEFALRSRGASDNRPHYGFQEFTLIALLGAVSGLLPSPWPGVITLGGLLVFLSIPFLQSDSRMYRPGVTQFAALATYLLAWLTTTPALPGSAEVSIALGVLLTLFLEARRSLRKQLSERITELEFSDTVRFLALIFVIYPVLPEGSFGPFGFLRPRKVWLFIILVSSISYFGYFFEKFLGSRAGFWLASILGGLASTTAVTGAMARRSADRPGETMRLVRATTLANSVQFPRVAAILAVAQPPLAMAAAIPLAVMTIAGLLTTMLLRLSKSDEEEAAAPVSLRNPFRILPALKFGLIFVAVAFLSKAALALQGTGTLAFTAIFGGLLDVDAIVATATEVFASGQIDISTGVNIILIAIAANGVAKAFLCFGSTNKSFAWKASAAMLAMQAAGWAWHLLHW
jgi:uncharacterized membrane protein (DUF4010 family)